MIHKIFDFFAWLFEDRVVDEAAEETKDAMLVTLGWDGLPTLVNEDGTIYSRKAELIFHREYYPNWPEQTWPIDPKTGEKCPIEKRK